MRGRDQFEKYKKILNFMAGFYRCLPLKMRLRSLEAHRNTRGKYGLAIRYALLKSVAASCGDNVSVFTGVYLLHPEGLMIGNNVSIQPRVYMEAQGGIEIGNDVSIAHDVSILSTTHVFSDPDTPIKDQGVIEKKIVIHDNVWIGCKAVILCGTEIGSGTVVGASSVVTKSLDGNSVYAGVPAEKKRERT